MFYLSSILITFSSSSLNESGFLEDSVILLVGHGIFLVVSSDESLFFSETGDLMDSLRGCCLPNIEDAFLEPGLCFELPGSESPFSATPIWLDALKNSHEMCPQEFTKMKFTTQIKNLSNHIV